MRTVPVLSAMVIIGVAAMTTACGQVQSGSLTGASAPPTVNNQVGHATCPGGAPALPAQQVITLSASDSGRSLCVERGTGLLIYLKGTLEQPWTRLISNSAVLIPRANGHLSLAVGVTGGYFVAVHRGVAVITSVRTPCRPRIMPPAAEPNNPVKPQCDLVESFHVTVAVAG